MRSSSEVKLLKIKQNLLDAFIHLEGKAVIDLNLYLKLKVKLEVCNELLVMARKHSIQENLKNIRGIKCE
jgi:hypothetical protein